MDTRVNVYTLIDYQSFYNQSKTLSDALNIVRNIPSITLLNYISGFNVNLYLRGNSPHAGRVQAYILDSLYKKLPEIQQNKWQEILQTSKAENESPVIIWNYSNLLFYNLIFRRFNNSRSRDLSKKDALAFFNAYLIVNFFVNSKVDIEEKELLEAEERNTIEEITIPGFIYQKDYASTIDFSNQITRGVRLFEYMENHAVFGNLIKEYYAERHVTGYMRLFKNLMVIFTELKIADDDLERNQLVNLTEYASAGMVDLSFIETLCINANIRDYKEDNSFGQLRQMFLYKFDKASFFVLDVNFLIDHLYKAQVFALNSFLKKKGHNDFLSIKAKEFMEGIYLPCVFAKCFPGETMYFGDQCVNSTGGELCDVYFRIGNRVLVIEFKDVMLGADVKNSGNKDALYGEFDKKFLKNQKNKPKGITQLINAIKDIQNNGVKFDENCPKGDLEIFPVILYTDFSFGLEGINKIFREKFNERIASQVSDKGNVNHITFINLNFFELHEQHLADKLLDVFTMLKEYHIHIEIPEYQLTPFEVFSRLYMNKNISYDPAQSAEYKEILERIGQA